MAVSYQKARGRSVILSQKKKSFLGKKKSTEVKPSMLYMAKSLVGDRRRTLSSPAHRAWTIAAPSPPLPARSAVLGSRGSPVSVSASASRLSISNRVRIPDSLNVLFRQKKKHRSKNFDAFLWRRVRDLNPGTAHHGYTISSRAPSTTQPTLHQLLCVALSNVFYSTDYSPFRQAFFENFFENFFSL